MELSANEIDYLLGKKYKEVYSERLGRKVYTLMEWVEKEVFKRHKKLFGFTDIGWTVKHPKQLIRALMKEGVWELEPIIREELAQMTQEMKDMVDE